MQFKTKNPLRSLLRGNACCHITEYRELKEPQYCLTQYACRSDVPVGGCLKSLIVGLTLKSVLFEWHVDMFEWHVDILFEWHVDILSGCELAM